MSAPYVLGLDTALDKTGVGKITQCDDGVCRAETHLIDMGLLPDRSIDERCRRVDSIGQRFGRIWRPGDPLPAMVGIEAAALDAKYGEAHTRAGLWFWLIMPLWLECVPIYEVSPLTLKKWAVGYAGSKQKPVEKEHVVAAMHQMWPGVVATSYKQRHHECEGLGIAQMGCQHLGWPVPVRRHHGEPLSVVKWPPGLVA